MLEAGLVPRDLLSHLRQLRPEGTKMMASAHLRSASNGKSISRLPYLGGAQSVEGGLLGLPG